MSRDFRQSNNETASSHFGSHFSSSQVLGSQFADYKHPHKRVYGKKVGRLSDDEPRPVPIPKDFAHLMIRIIDEACFHIFLTQVSAFVYRIVIYNSLCQLLCWAFLFTELCIMAAHMSYRCLTQVGIQIPRRRRRWWP